MNISEHVRRIIRRFIPGRPTKILRNILYSLDIMIDINKQLITSIGNSTDSKNKSKVVDKINVVLGETEAQFAHAVHELDVNYKSLKLMKMAQPSSAAVRELISGDHGLTRLRSVFWQLPETGLPENYDLELFRDYIRQIDDDLLNVRRDISIAINHPLNSE